MVAVVDELTEIELRALADRVFAEYREMPGLSLTAPQARRLWGCDACTCDRVIDELLRRGALRWSRGQLIRADRDY